MSVASSNELLGLDCTLLTFIILKVKTILAFDDSGVDEEVAPLWC